MYRTTVYKDSTNNSFHAASHADLIETADGWWLVCQKRMRERLLTLPVGKPYEGKLHVRFDEGEWRKPLSTLHSNLICISFFTSPADPGNLLAGGNGKKANMYAGCKVK
jgi:hypothetical protein